MFTFEGLAELRTSQTWYQDISIDDVFRRMKQLQKNRVKKRKSALLIVVKGVWMQHKGNFSLNTLKTCFPNDLLTMTNGVWNFSAKVWSVLVISHTIISVFVFCVRSSHWFEVGRLEKGDVPNFHATIQCSSIWIKRRWMLWRWKIICLCCQATVNQSWSSHIHTVLKKQISWVFFS